MRSVMPLLMMIPVLLCACTSGPKAAPYNLVIYSKTGGFIGFDQRFIVRSDGELLLDDRRTGQTYQHSITARELAALQTLVESQAFLNTDRLYEVKDGADLITYTIEAATPQRKHTVTTMDAAEHPAIVTDAIREIERLLLQTMERSAKPSDG